MTSRLLCPLLLLLLVGCSPERERDPSPAPGGVDAGVADAGGESDTGPSAPPVEVDPPAPPVPPELPRLDDWACPPGWLPTPIGEGEVWEHNVCEPPPQLDCPDGQMQILGESECSLIGRPCPAQLGGWDEEEILRGLAPGFAGEIVYVSRDARRNSDGSRDRPFRYIADGLEAAESGDIVAVSDGRYAEQVVVDKAIALVGACAEKTVILPAGRSEDLYTPEGTSAGEASVEVTGEGGALITQLRVDGDRPGIVISGTEAPVVVRHVFVDRPLRTGVLFGLGAAGGELSESLVLGLEAGEGPGIGRSRMTAGVYVNTGAPVRVLRSSVIDSDEGAIMHGQNLRDEPADVVVQDVVVRRCAGDKQVGMRFGRFVWRRGLVEDSAGSLLYGVGDLRPDVPRDRAELDVSDVLFRGNLSLSPDPFPDWDVPRWWKHDVKPITTMNHLRTKLRQVRVVGSFSRGVVVESSGFAGEVEELYEFDRLVVEGVPLEQVLAVDSSILGHPGTGLDLDPGTAATCMQCVFLNNRAGGITLGAALVSSNGRRVLGSTMTLTDSVIGDTMPLLEGSDLPPGMVEGVTAPFDYAGEGLVLFLGSRVVALRVLIAGSHSGGMAGDHRDPAIGRGREIDPTAAAEAQTTMSLTDVVVANTGTGSGVGIGVRLHGGVRATMRRVSVAASTGAAFAAWGYETGGAPQVEAEDLMLRDSVGRDDGQAGFGLLLEDGAQMSAQRMAVIDNQELGIRLRGQGAGLPASLSVEDLEVRDTRSREDGMMGRGMLVTAGAQMDLVRAAVVGNREIAVSLEGEGSHLEAHHLSIRDTAVAACGELADTDPLRCVTEGQDRSAGVGLSIANGSTGEVGDFLVSGSALAGVYVGEGGSLRLDRGAIIDNRIGLAVAGEAFDIGEDAAQVLVYDNEVDLSLDVFTVPEPELAIISKDDVRPRTLPPPPPSP